MLILIIEAATIGGAVVTWRRFAHIVFPPERLPGLLLVVNLGPYFCKYKLDVCVFLVKNRKPRRSLKHNSAPGYCQEGFIATVGELRNFDHFVRKILRTSSSNFSLCTDVHIFTFRPPNTQWESLP